MAEKKQAGELGMRQTYKQTGHLGFGGGPGEKTIDNGPSGSKRANNAVLNQNKLTTGQKVGPGKNLKDIKGGGNFY